MYKYLKSAADRLFQDFEESAEIVHNLTKGEARESSVVKHFLRPLLPSRYSLTSGIIIDSDDKQSRQQDIIIFDGLNTPILKDLEHSKLLFPESVSAVVEVKSTLTKANLEDTFRKADSIYSLQFRESQEINLTSGFQLQAVKPPILVVGFFFKSDLQLKSIRNIFETLKQDTEYSNALSFICILEDKEKKPGLIVHSNGDNLNQIVLIPDNNSRIALVNPDTKGDSLMQMYLMINEYLQKSGFFMPTPDFLNYAQKAGFNTGKIEFPIESIKGAKFKTKDGEYRIDDALVLQNLVKKHFAVGLNEMETLQQLLIMGRMPLSKKAFDPNCYYFELKIDSKGNKKYKRLDIEKPRTILASAQRIASGKENKTDKDLFKKYKDLIDRVGRKELTITIRAV